MVRIVKQAFGTVKNESGILLGIYGANRQEILEYATRLYNYGATSTKLDSEGAWQIGESIEGAHLHDKRVSRDSSDSVGFWSDGFAVILVDEKSLRAWLLLEAIDTARAQNGGTLESFKGTPGGIKANVIELVNARFESIPYEHIISPHGLGRIEVVTYGESKVEHNEYVGDEVETLSLAAHANGAARAESETVHAGTK